MSIIGNTHLNGAVKKTHEPEQILEILNRQIKKSLKQNKTQNDDGMDVCLCRIDTTKENKCKLTFCGAKRPLFIYRAATKSIEKIKGSLKSIGGEEVIHLSFAQKEITISENDVLYLTSDGYTDQCNPKRKNYSVKRMLELIQENGHKSMLEQHLIFEESFDNYKEYEKQRDDVTIIGVKLDR